MKQKKPYRSYYIIVVFLLTALSLLPYGCGYHVAGMGGGMPGGVKSISVPFFKNLTRRPDVETVITSAIVSELIHTNSLKLVTRGGGEAVLTGLVKSYSLEPVSYSNDDITREYRLRVVLSVKLTRASDEKILWRDDNFNDYEDFKVDSSDVGATKTAEWNALKKMSVDMARLLKERLLEDF